MIKKKRKFLIVILTFVGITVFSGSVAALQSNNKRVNLYYGDNVIALNTSKSTVSEVLEGADIELASDDLVNTDLDTEVKDGMEIVVSKAFYVTVNVDGSPMRVRTNKATVGEVVENAVSNSDVDLYTKSHAKTDEVEPNMVIEVTTEKMEIIKETEKIPFTSITMETDELPVGEERIAQAGSDGERVITSQVEYLGTMIMSRTKLSDEITVEPVPEIIEKGTKVKNENAVPVSSYNKLPVSGDLVYKEHYVMNASAYTTDRGDAGAYTATGERCRVGLVAVDPNVIPLGTILYIEGYGEARAADTGGAIKGHKIDLYFDTYGEMTNFGRRQVNVYVLDN